MALAAVPAGVVVAKLFGLYDADHRAIRHLTIDELPSIVVWCCSLAIACALLAPGMISVTTFVLVSLPAIVLAAALRCLVRFVCDASRRRGPPSSSGAGEPAEAIARKIGLFEDMHLELAGVEGPATISSGSTATATGPSGEGRTDF